MTNPLVGRAIQPLHDRILVERLPGETKKGKIVIPDCARETSKYAKVIAVGPGKWTDRGFVKTAVKPGDIVLLPGCAAKFPDWEEQDVIMVQEADIGAIIA